PSSADGPDSAMIVFHSATISPSAASHVMGVKTPSPFAPVRLSGVASRSGECTSSASRLTLAQAKPAVKGWSGSPWIRTTRSFSTCARSEHMSGQSWAQATRTTCKGSPHFSQGTTLAGGRLRGYASELEADLAQLAACFGVIGLAIGSGFMELVKIEPAPSVELRRQGQVEDRLGALLDRAPRFHAGLAHHG